MFLHCKFSITIMTPPHPLLLCVTVPYERKPNHLSKLLTQNTKQIFLIKGATIPTRVPHILVLELHYIRECYDALAEVP